MKRGDWLVMLFALLTVPSLYAAYWPSGGAGTEAVVLVDGKPWARVDLAHDQELDVPGPLGNSHLVVAGGQVRFQSSPCAGKQCIHQGWLHEGGEFAACVPNRVSVQVIADEPRYDSISF